MGFLGIGSWEILLILILALIILGPSKLTDFARTLGKTVRAIKKASADLTTAVTREMDITRNELKPPPKEDSNTKSTEAPPTTGKAETPGKDDKPAKSGEAPAAK